MWLLVALAAAESPLPAFHAWLRAGGASATVEARDGGAFGRGLFATQDVAAGDLLVDVPLELCASFSSP